MEHFLFIRLIFWAALLAFIIIIALICVLAEKLSVWIKALKRKSEESLTEKAVIARSSVDSLDQLAA